MSVMFPKHLSVQRQSTSSAGCHQPLRFVHMTAPTFDRAPAHLLRAALNDPAQLATTPSSTAQQSAASPPPDTANSNANVPILGSNGHHTADRSTAALTHPAAQDSHVATTAAAGAEPLSSTDSDMEGGYPRSFVTDSAAAEQSHREGQGASVTIKGISKFFEVKGGVYTAVENIDLFVPKNSITALLGPSGSGKTTLLRMIAGLEEPSAGQILLDDTDVTRCSIKERNIGFTFQNYALFRHMTVAENIAFGPKVRRLDVDVDARVKELLQLVELPDVGNRLPNQLSGGQRQRIALARALGANPQLLLLDEPFGALDPLVRKNLRAGLRAIVERVGVTTIMVTHDLEEAMEVADRIVIFNRGKIEQQGDKLDVARRPASPFVMNFMGEVNSVPNNCQLVRRMGFKTEKSLVMFRPVDVEISPADPSVDLTASRLCPATIADKRNLGWRVNYIMECDDGVRLEMHVAREENDEKYEELDTLQRVFVRVAPLSMMGYAPRDIDSSPLDLV